MPQEKISEKSFPDGSKHLSFTVCAGQQGQRLDVFVTLMAQDLTRSHVQKLLEEKHLTVNGKTVKAGYKVREQDQIDVVLPPAKLLSAAAEPIKVPVVYEDDYLAVVNKPRGMVVHPAHGHEDGTLVNALMYQLGGRLSTINGVIRPGIVHRIDKDTSGLLAVCKTDEAHRGLSELLKSHAITRVYHGVVHGHLPKRQGTIDAPIGRMDSDRKKMTVRADGRPAVTHYKVLEEYGSYSYVEFTLETGRTHQIRVHMKSIGHPLMGDPLYGPPHEETAAARQLEKEDFWPGQILHAKVLGFVHPITGEDLLFTSELPDYFQKVLRVLRGE